MLDTINYCVITQAKAKILKPFIGSDDEREYKYEKEYHTGVDIECHGEVYSISFGTVLNVGQNIDEKTFNVIILDEDGNGYNYSGLYEYQGLEVGDYVDAGQVIGSTENYVHFEYLQTVPTVFPVRVEGLTLYKYDPEFLLEDNILLSSSTDVPDIRLQPPDKYDDLLCEYVDEMDELDIEDDEDDSKYSFGVDDEDDDPDNFGSEDTGYADDYEMPLDDVEESINPR